MAHPNVSEASDVPANSGDAVEDFADFLEGMEGEEEEESSPDEGEEEPEAEEAEGDEGAQDDEDEPDTAIDPPVSWGTDAKELFKQLPAALQTQVVEREAQREKAIQRATTEAAEARRTALVEASTAVAETQRQYASQLEQYAEVLKPQIPDPALAQEDPTRYIQEFSLYQALDAQHKIMVQQANAASQEAAEREQAVMAEQYAAEARILATELPEWNDLAQRQALLTELEKVGVELGYSEDTMRKAGATDVLALKKAAEWKAKAEKYDGLQKSKMEKVRSAKTLPKVVKPGVAPTRGEISAARSQAAWQQVKTARSKNAQADAFADYLESSGLI